MRKVVAAIMVSLDGVMQAPGGPEEDPSGGFAFGGWTFPHFDQAGGEMIDELFAEPFDLLLGRRTYDIFAGYWPKAEQSSIGRKFNACTKYVATRSRRSFDWEKTVPLRGDAAAEVAELKKGTGPTLIVQGSGDFLQSLIGTGLVDEFRLLVFPVLLGSGKRLFEDGTKPGALALVETRSTPAGVILARYHPAGEVRTGDFGPPEDAA